MPHPTLPTLSAAAEKHLGSYALAAAAGAGALTAAQVGHAAVLSFTYNNEVLQPSGNSTASFSLFTGGPILGDLRSASSPGSVLYRAGLPFAATSVAKAKVVATSHYATGTNLTAGAAISARRTFTKFGYSAIGATTLSKSKGLSTSHRGNFINKTGYLGFEFTDPNNAAQTDFGWVRVGENAHQTALTIFSAAYDDTGAPILAGAVPESTSVGLLAAGACGLGLWRRQAAQRRAARGRPGAAEVAPGVNCS